MIVDQQTLPTNHLHAVTGYPLITPTHEFMRPMINPSEVVGYDRLMAAVQARLEDQDFAEAWSAGQAMTIEDLQALVM